VSKGLVKRTAMEGARAEMAKFSSWVSSFFCDWRLGEEDEGEESPPRRGVLLVVNVFMRADEQE